MKALQVKNAPPGVVVCACHRHLVEGGSRWYLSNVRKSGKRYVSRDLWSHGKQKHVMMSRTVKGVTNPREQVVFLNGNTLDHRCVNLAVLPSRGKVNQYRASPARTETGMKGVIPTGYGRYYVCMSVNGKNKRIGTYDTVIEAARAYNAAAIKYRGQFARLNKIS